MPTIINSPPSIRIQDYFSKLQFYKSNDTQGRRF